MGQVTQEIQQSGQGSRLAAGRPRNLLQAGLLFFCALGWIGLVVLRGLWPTESMWLWLPWARELLTSETLTTTLSTSAYDVAVPDSPLIAVLAAGVMAVFPINDFFLIILPVFFGLATLGILWRWGKAVNLPLLTATLLTATISFHPSTIQWGLSITPWFGLLAVFTYFFYQLEQLRQAPSSRRFFFITLAASIGLLMSRAALPLLLILVVVWIQHRRYRQLSGWLTWLLLLPPAVWLISYGGQLTAPLPYNDHILLVATLPLILPALYGLAKRRDWLVGGSVFVMLAIQIGWLPVSWLMAPYSFLLLGILAFSAFRTLVEERSPVVLGIFSAVAIWVLLQIEPITTSGRFLAGWEQRWQWLLGIAQTFHQLAILVALGMGGLVFWISRRSADRGRIVVSSLIALGVLATPLLQVSWLTSWLPILAVVLLICLLAVLPKIQLFRPIFISVVAVAIVGLVVGIPIAYSTTQGFVFPNPARLQNAKLSDQVLQADQPGNHGMIVISEEAAALNWIFGYARAIEIDSPRFVAMLGHRYQTGRPAREIQQWLAGGGVEYVVRMNADYQDLSEIMNTTSTMSTLLFNEDVPEIPGRVDVIVWKLQNTEL